MRLPDEAPTEIVDPFVVLNHPELPQVPMPLDALRDEESRAAWPASDIVGHLFTKDEATRERYERSEQLGTIVEELDRNGIGRAGIPLSADTPREIFDQIAELDGRIFVSLRANPHDGMRAVRTISELAERYPFIRAISLTPFQIYPFIEPSSKEYYPIYTKCAELGLPVFINIGFPGPRVPAAIQDPIHLDEVCWFFPELTVVMRHGAEPWEDLAVKLMLKWPNLYYSTSAFAPRYYPKAIIDYANTRGADKVIYGGYFPMGLTLERIFGDLPGVPLKEEVWPKFLRSNARRVLGLD